MKEKSYKQYYENEKRRIRKELEGEKKKLSRPIRDRSLSFCCGSAPIIVRDWCESWVIRCPHCENAVSSAERSSSIRLWEKRQSGCSTKKGSTKRYSLPLEPKRAETMFFFERFEGFLVCMTRIGKEFIIVPVTDNPNPSPLEVLEAGGNGSTEFGLIQFVKAARFVKSFNFGKIPQSIRNQYEELRTAYRNSL